MTQRAAAFVPCWLAALRLSAILTLVTHSFAWAQDLPPIRGDVDGDRVIVLSDLFAVRQAIDGLLVLPPDASARADVNQDGKVDEEDYTAMIFPALEGDSGCPFQDPEDPLPRITSVAPNFGPPGTKVTITGSAFGPHPLANSIWFGDTPALILSASSTEAVVEVPATAGGRVRITNLQTGLTSALHSFVIATTDTPDYNTSLPVGEVILGAPAEIPLPNAWFTVPVAVRLPGDIDLGSIGVMMSFDPGHVEVIEVLATTPDYLSPMPPCIDNASGLLGSGAIRNQLHLKSLSAGGVPSSGDEVTLSLFSVVFKCIAYRHAAPKVVARLEVLADTAFPANPIGAAAPRFVGTTASAFPPVGEHPIGLSLAEVPLAEVPHIVFLDPSGPPKKRAPLLLGATSLPGTKTNWVPFFNYEPSVITKVKDESISVLAKKWMPSSTLMVLDTSRGVFSNDLLYLTPESEAPTVALTIPENGASLPTGSGDIVIVFSETMQSLSIVDDGISLLVTTSNGAVSSVGFSANLTPYLGSRVVLRPITPFPKGAQVKVSLGSTLRDLNRNPLAPATFTFSS